MICYLDTSALVKLYVQEEGSALVQRHIREADLVATAKIAYAETRAAFARCLREGVLSETAYREVVANFAADWPAYFVLELTDAVILRAGELAERFALRGFDSIHLASVLTLLDKLSRDQAREQLTVGCWDRRLGGALDLLGLSRFP